MNFILPSETLNVLVWVAIAVFIISIALLISNKHLTTLEKFALCLGTFFVPIIGGLFAIVFVLFSRRVKQIN